MYLEYNAPDTAKLLREFQKLIDKRTYSERIEYGVWKKMATAERGLTILWSPERNHITVYDKQTGESYYVFSTDVCGFGQFMLTKFQKKMKMQEKEKENENMNGFNFDFGTCANDNIRMSMYGLAIKNNAGEWVSFDKDRIVNVDVFNFDGRNFLFKMPVAIKDIAVGDIVIHNRVPMFVTSTEGGIHVVDIRAGEKKEIMPTTNMFGFDFVTKIVSMFGALTNQTATPDQPFGNMLPFLMMNDENSDNSAMAMFMMMQSQGQNMNPMMFYALSKMQGGEFDPMMFFVMQQMMNK